MRYTFTATPELGAELSFLVVRLHWLAYEESLATVSYTHLTLPTKLSV